MWSYYGSKSKIIKYYPPPKYDKIIEPFAGTAQYSLKYYDRDVVLVDKYEVIIKIWKWLQQCSPGDVLGLPRLKYGETVDDYEFDCIEAKWFIGMIIVGAPTRPKLAASKWKTELRPNAQNYKLEYAANNLFRIRHWEIVHGDYFDIKNQEATWFIDPPYQSSGKYYKYNDIDYEFLSKWARERKGQSIVCEQEGADWLPFKVLIRQRGINSSSNEMIYTHPDNQWPWKMISFDEYLEKTG